ncbi:MAG: thioredoxin family protein [Coriobacteriales bacterium]
MESVFDSDVIMEITDESTWEEKVDNAPGRVMVEFFVTWCPHCQREAPLLDEMAPNIRELGVEVYHANAEVMWTKGSVYDISETPSFILVEDGELIAKHEGFLTKDELVAFAQGKVDDLAPSFEQSLSSALQL